jgi:O-antigen/teichoic acid export membrane protein
MKTGQSGRRALLAGGGWSVLEQGLSAGSNFLINLLLLRGLPTLEYGSYATASAALLFLLAMQAALFSDPVLVLSATKYPSRIAEYFSAVFRAQNWSTPACIALGGAAGLVALAYGHRLVAESIFGVALCWPALLRQQMTRRACYAELSPRTAALNSATQLVISTGLVLLLKSLNILSVAAGFAATAFSAWVSAWMMLRNRPEWRLPTTRPFMWEIAREHWEQGKWGFWASPLRWLPRNLLFFILPYALGSAAGLEANAAIRAASLIALPGVHAMVALASILTPTFARTPPARHVRMALRLAIPVVGGALVYWLAVVLAREQLCALLMPVDLRRYADLLFWLGALPTAGAIAALVDSALLAQQRGRVILGSDFVAVGATLLLSWPLSAYWGAMGACAAMLGSVGCRLLYTTFGLVQAQPTGLPASPQQSNP